jgi:hypothetical protein
MTAKTIATGGGWMARCPAYDDHTPSLSIRDAGSKVLVHCHAGYDQERVTSALRTRGLWSDHRPRSLSCMPGTPRANDLARLRRETAWGHAGQPKPIFGLDALPLNVAGGQQLPGAPHVAHVIPGFGAARTPTVGAKADSDGLDIPASLVWRPAP